MTKEQEAIAEKILNTLEKQVFSRWYAIGNFDTYLQGTYPTGDPRRVEKDQILGEIVKLFHL